MIAQAASVFSTYPGAGTAGESNLVSTNPTRPNEIVATGFGAPIEDVRAAAGAALEAQRKWAILPGAARAEHLIKWAEAIAARSDELAGAIVREVGKPVGEAKGEVGRCIAILRYFAGDAVRDCGLVIPGLTSAALQYAVQRPLGVVALITPWNFPLAIPLWKAAPALACGNSVLLKPSEEAILCGSLLAETAKAAGLPEGVFNVLIGGAESGRALLKADVHAVSFTGSAKTGALVAGACAARNIKFQTEMGGKNPAIVLADADLNQAAVLVASGAMRYAGQKCTATSRAIVERKAHDRFLPLLIEATKALPVGDPSEGTTAVGPVINEAAHARLLSFLACQPHEVVYSGESANPGYFIAPTILADVPADSEAGQSELFGPILALQLADDVDQAIDLANGVEYGLSASLFTSDLAAAMNYVARIEAGMVRVNADTTGVDPHAPFGGVKGSSSGSREQGPSAKDFYTEIRTVQINPK